PSHDIHTLRHYDYLQHLPGSNYHVFFHNQLQTPEIYTLSLHDALPISKGPKGLWVSMRRKSYTFFIASTPGKLRKVVVPAYLIRSEEHTSELQSRVDLVCRLLLEKKKKVSSKVGSETRKRYYVKCTY